MTVEWIWLIFVFAVGGCIGSFLNVIIYRMPLDKSIVNPPSACLSCGKQIAFYDNIPMLSWLVLGGKCRHCDAKISVQYFLVELLVAFAFAGLFVLYFVIDFRCFDIDGATGIMAFIRGGWLLYVVHIALFAAFVAASAIDLDLWVIPLPICWFVTLVGVIGSAVSRVVMDPMVVYHFRLFPSASLETGAMGVGCMLGMCLSLLAVKKGLIKRSYADEDDENYKMTVEGREDDYEDTTNHRLEVLKELVFLAPIVVCGFGFLWIVKNTGLSQWWEDFSGGPVVNGVLGSLWGYCIGCGLVWATRILGTLGFGKEAMGLGDVHLMGAAGAVIGPLFVLIAFFIAPFFGLLWVGGQIFSRKIRQIPYGPFLSLGVFAVIIFHDRIMDYLKGLYLYS